jgi:hypothetical protein
MTTLIFMDRGWTVMTSAWSAGSKNDKTTTLVYVWGADGESWSDSATGDASCTLEMPIKEFIGRVQAAGPICDLR